MSDRDQALVQSLGVSVAELANAMNKSRQTVNRGIRADSDYLKPRDLMQALGVWERSDSALYSLARSKICEMYPELAEAIVAGADSADFSQFSVDVPGEYWFVTGDFANFRTNLQACSRQLEELAAKPEVQIKLIVNSRDYSAAQRFAARFKSTVEAICCGIPFAFVPTMLLRMDHSDRMDVFGVLDSGFIPLSRQEAARLRFEIERMLMASEPAN